MSNPEEVRIQIILSSTRDGRFRQRVANRVYDVAAKREDLIAELIDLRDWPLPFFSSGAACRMP